MTPVFQTDFSNTSGNCLQAVIASLFDSSLEETPHFIMEENWRVSLKEFYKSKGYNYDSLNGYMNPNYDYLINKEFNKINPSFPMDLSNIQSVNGYYSAVVLSPKYFKNKNLHVGHHAVIIDKDCNIVHDPVYDYNGIIYPLSKILGSNGVIFIDKIEKI